MDILEKLSLATSRIAKYYFALPVAGLKKPLLRERVYCYELYHQLRSILPTKTQRVLTAETDKRGNPSFTNQHPIPDFIFHQPGFHASNSVAIEVECRVNRTHLRKDFRTFRSLKDKGYRQFILLLFGVKDIRWDVLSQVAQEVDIKLDEVSVMLHPEAGVKASLQKPLTHANDFKIR